VLEIPRL